MSGRSQDLIIQNSTTTPLEVMVEVTPDRYVLAPGDKMIIHGAPGQAPHDLLVHDYGLQIYPAGDGEPVVTVNGKRAEPDWETPGPNAQRKSS